MAQEPEGAVGWLRPAPWLLALLLVLSAIWSFAVSRFLRADLGTTMTGALPRWNVAR